ncbi:MAG: hypothetical protein OXG68_14365 [Chloroflexi bacterium]|nr:hypothetical protein [Chloroflexota bacterium]
MRANEQLIHYTLERGERLPRYRRARNHDHIKSWAQLGMRQRQYRSQAALGSVADNCLAQLLARNNAVTIMRQAVLADIYQQMWMSIFGAEPLCAGEIGGPAQP